MLIEAGNPHPKEKGYGRLGGGWLISEHKREYDYYNEIEREYSSKFQYFDLIVYNNNKIRVESTEGPRDLYYEEEHLYRELFNPTLNVEDNLIAFKKHLIKVINDQGEFK
jgi:hypothetical protein